MRELLAFGGPASLASVAWAGFRNGDYAIIGATLGPGLAGIYWRAYQLAVEYQRKIALAMAQIAFPVLSRTTGIEELLAAAPADGPAARRHPLPAAGDPLPAWRRCWCRGCSGRTGTRR